MALAQPCTPCPLLPAWGEGGQAAQAASSAWGTPYPTSFSWLGVPRGVHQHPLVPSPWQMARAGTVALLGLLLRGDLVATGQGDPWLVAPSPPSAGLQGPGREVRGLARAPAVLWSPPGDTELVVALSAGSGCLSCRAIAEFIGVSHVSISQRGIKMP